MKMHCLRIAAAGLSVLAVAALSQETSRSAWDGVYTVDQAKRGGRLVVTHCAACHGDRLDGSEAGPALVGREFMLGWSGHQLNEIVDRIQSTMPADHPGKLSREEVADVVAFLLASNHFPTGRAELPSDPKALARIRLDAEKPKN